MLALNEPLSCCGRHFLIGRNRRGHWVVRDDGGLRGGLFVNRAEAMRYALRENGRRSDAIVMVADGLEL